MRILHLDCSSGLTGEMTVGALCDIGVTPSIFEWELSKVDLGDFHTHFDRDAANGVGGIRFSLHSGATHHVSQDEKPCGCGHDHHHGDHHHHHDHSHSHTHSHPHTDSPSHEGETGRLLADLEALLRAADLSDFVKEHSLSIFRRIAIAESTVRGIPLEKVTFPHSGKLSFIATVIGFCAGLEQLKVEKISVSPFVNKTHSEQPHSAAVVREILRETDAISSDQAEGRLTPVTAAMVAEFGIPSALTSNFEEEKTGYGLGSDGLPPVRATVGRLN